MYVYAGIASMLPVWLLLQPRDYINGAQLVLGLFVLYTAVLLTMPDVAAPMINDVAEGTPPIFPILFARLDRLKQMKKTTRRMEEFRGLYQGHNEMTELNRLGS